MKIMIIFGLIISQSAISLSLPKIYTSEQKNNEFWYYVCNRLIEVTKSYDISINISESDFFSPILVEGKIFPNFKRNFSRALCKASSSTNQSTEAIKAVSSFTMKLLFEQGHISLIEERLEKSPFRHFQFKFEKQGLGAEFTLKSLKPYTVNIPVTEMGHTANAELRINPPHSFFETNNLTFPEIRRLAHKGYMKWDSSTNSYFLTKQDPIQFAFIFHPLSEVELIGKSNYGNREYALFDRALKMEGTSLVDYYKCVQSLYDRNFDVTINDPSLKLDRPTLVPKIHHKIWVTNSDNPKEMPEKYFVWWEQSLPVMKPEEGWQHWLWVEDENIHPKTVERAKSLGITIKHIWEDCPDIEPFRPAIEFALAKKWFSLPSDILRGKLCYEFGGVYLDTDYRVYRDLTPLCQRYHFCMGHEPCAAKIGSSSLLSVPKHPIVRKFLEYNLKLYSFKSQPTYLTEDNPLYDEHMRYAIYGSMFALAVALLETPQRDDRKDIILPPMYLYPTHKDVYPTPISDVYVPGEIPPPHSFANHYWELSWQK